MTQNDTVWVKRHTMKKEAVSFDWMQNETSDTYAHSEILLASDVKKFQVYQEVNDKK